MKKIAFLHATDAVKNGLNRGSLYLEEIPLATLSQQRAFKADEKETLLESVLRDCIALDYFSEIVVITSLKSCDDAIESLVMNLTFPIPVHCERIDEHSNHAIVERNLTALPAEWPYLRRPAYGAWHAKGLEELAQRYEFNIAFIANVDSLHLLDRDLFFKHTSKLGDEGLLIKNITHGANEAVLITRSFYKTLRQRYDSRLKEKDKERDKSSVTLISLIRAHVEYSGKTHYTEAYHIDPFPFLPIHRSEDLSWIRDMHSQNLSLVLDTLKSSKMRIPFAHPTFIEIELIDSSGRMMDVTLFEKQLQSGSHHLLALNLLINAVPSSELEMYLAIAETYVGLIMLECSAAVSPSFAIGWLGEAGLRRLKVLHLHADEARYFERIQHILTQLAGGMSERPYLVLEISPVNEKNFSALRPLIDKLVLKSAGASREGGRAINFAPLHRHSCHKLTSSLFLSADGSRDACRYRKSPIISSDSVLGTFHSNELRQLRDEHQRGDYSSAQCASCTEWFTRDIIPLSATLSLFNPSVYQALDWLKTVSEEEAGQIRKQLDEILSVLDEKERMMGDPFPFAFRELSLLFIQKMRFAFRNCYIPLGDRLIELGRFEQALECWELVLKHDPMHPSVHTRLEQLTETVS